MLQSTSLMSLLLLRFEPSDYSQHPVYMTQVIIPTLTFVLVDVTYNIDTVVMSSH